MKSDKTYISKCTSSVISKLLQSVETVFIQDWHRWHSVTVSQCHNVTESQCHSVTVSQCHSVTHRSIFWRIFDLFRFCGSIKLLRQKIHNWPTSLTRFISFTRFVVFLVANIFAILSVIKVQMNCIWSSTALEEALYRRSCNELVTATSGKPLHKMHCQQSKSKNTKKSLGPEADCDVIGRVNQMHCWIFSLIKNLHQQRQGNTSCGASCQADLIQNYFPSMVMFRYFWHLR